MLSTLQVHGPRSSSWTAVQPERRYLLLCHGVLGARLRSQAVHGYEYGIAPTGMLVPILEITRIESTFRETYSTKLLGGLPSAWTATARRHGVSC